MLIFFRAYIYIVHQVTLDELLCVVTKWKDPLKKFGGPRNFPPMYRAIATYEWVRSNFGSFIVTYTYHSCSG